MVVLRDYSAFHMLMSLKATCLTGATTLSCSMLFPATPGELQQALCRKPSAWMWVVKKEEGY